MIHFTLTDSGTGVLTDIQVEIKAGIHGIGIYVKSHEPDENHPIAVLEVHNGNLQLLTFGNNDVIDPVETIIFQSSVTQKANHAYELARNGEILSEEQKEDISKDSKFSFLYSRDVLKASFPEGEEAISEISYYSYAYAENILKGPFILGEKAISKDAYHSVMYAGDVLKSRFLAGEEAISKDVHQAIYYSNYILKGRFELAEEIIFNSSYAETYKKQFKLN
jgi:hypothetical protein